MKRIVIAPDTHCPIQDRLLTRSLINFIGDYQPDEVVHIGDLMDYPQPSRWAKDTREEFEGSVFVDSDSAKEDYLEPLRAVYAGPVGVHVGNHDRRPSDYLKKYAPALDSSKAFELETLLDFEKYEITRLPEFYDIAPGWISTHGDRGGIRLNQVAGLTALNAARRFGKSVVMGHVHRLGCVSYTQGYGGDVETTITGMEVGHMVNVTLAGYLKGMTPNWQTGFGILYVDDKHVKAEAIPITGKKFVVEGTTYNVR